MNSSASSASAGGMIETGSTLTAATESVTGCASLRGRTATATATFAAAGTASKSGCSKAATGPSAAFASTSLTLSCSVVGASAGGMSASAVEVIIPAPEIKSRYGT